LRLCVFAVQQLTTEIPSLETPRLLIRPFVMDDLEAVHRILDLELDFEPQSLEGRRSWLAWTVLNYAELAHLYQPPYGDRAVALKADGRVIGACGFVPCLSPFEQLPGWNSEPGVQPVPHPQSRSTPAFGLFYAISPAHQRQGYASEAAQALVDYAFVVLNLKRVIATTDHDNLGSIGVMQRLGMRILRNPQSEPPWLQVVGVVENPG
jgi:ribosomal-protein-alanine N-acetyltransferase